MYRKFPFNSVSINERAKSEIEFPQKECTSLSSDRQDKYQCDVCFITLSSCDGSVLRNSNSKIILMHCNVIVGRILFQLVSVLALSECRQLRPDCSQLQQYAMPSEDQRLELFEGVEALAPKKDVGLKVVSFI